MLSRVQTDNCFMDRRSFIKAAGISVIALAASSYCYLENEAMKKAPEIKGKVLADLHSHLSKNNKLEDIVKTLSWGVTGLTTRYGNDQLISYDIAMQIPGAREIDPRLFAEIPVGESKGYFIKTQEIEADFHILALGCQDDLPHFEDARKAVEAIHAAGGIAILNHPCTIAKREHGIIPFRTADEHDEEKIIELCDMVDEVEVFNAQNINAVPVIAWMKRCNDKAKEIVAKRCMYNPHKGIASSDAHRILSQSKVSGIYIPEESLCIESIKEYLWTGNFERYEQYVSRLSFLEGMFFSK